MWEMIDLGLDLCGSLDHTNRISERSLDHIKQLPHFSKAFYQLPLTGRMFHLMIHEEVVDGGADPGRHRRDDVEGRQVGHADVVVRQKGGNQTPDGEDWDG
jgi:hypothetical protein